MASNVSDFIIETTTKEYGSLASVKNCDKNPGHVGFYSLNNLTVDILPEECRTTQRLNYIRDFSKRIVRLIINKPDGSQMFGTGCVFMRHGDYSGLDKYYIQTNEHVIGCQEDVSNCKIEFFYNTEDRAGIETSYGVEFLGCFKKPDLCYFNVTNIPDTVKLLFLPPDLTLPMDIPSPTDINNIIVISHPHGGPKTITIGKYLGYELVNDVVKYIHTARTCPGSSGAVTVETRHVNRPYSWRWGFYPTHYAGKRGDVYNINNGGGTFGKEVTSETNNINYCVRW